MKLVKGLGLFVTLSLLLSVCAYVPSTSAVAGMGMPPSVVSSLLSYTDDSVVEWESSVVENDATLADLSLTNGELDPAFSSGVTAYSMTVATDTKRTTVTATPTDSKATYTVNNKSTDLGHIVALNPAGENTTVTVEVTAADGTTTQDYVVTVVRPAPPPSNVATLSALSLTGGDLDPAFSSGVTAYTLHVASDTAETESSVTTTDAQATYTVNGKDKLGKNIVPLNAAGSNTTVTIEVTAEDGTTTKDYDIVVIRAPVPPPSDDASLKSLVVSPGPLAPTFAPSTLNYMVHVSNNVSHLDVTAAAKSVNAVIRIDNVTVPTGVDSVPLKPAGEETLVTIKVTDGDATEIYTISVTRAPNSDASLQALSVTPGGLEPLFDPQILDYRLEVGEKVESINISAISQDPSASVTIDDILGGQQEVPLNPGATNITITCLAGDRVTALNYTILVTRSKHPKGPTALSTLTVSPGLLSPIFNSSVFKYYVDEAIGARSVDIEAVPADSSSTVSINGVVGQKATVPLGNPGSRKDVKIVVKGDKESVTYTVTFGRATADSELKNLTVLTGHLEPAFDHATHEYRLIIDSKNASEVFITAVPDDNNASIYINDEHVNNSQATDFTITSDLVEFVIVVNNTNYSQTIYTLRLGAAEKSSSGMPAYESALIVVLCIVALVGAYALYRFRREKRDDGYAALD